MSPKSEKKSEATQEKEELLTVVVPCLNEEDSIEATVEEILASSENLPLRVEVLMIDDGSTDNTLKIMEELRDRHPECNLVVNPTNLGVGRSVLNSYNIIDPESWVTCFPGDNEMVFAGTIKNYLSVRHDNDLILGYLQNPVIRTTMRRWASSAFTTAAAALYGYPYRYLNGVKMYRCWVFRDIEVVSNGHAVNAELIAKAQLRHPGLRVTEVPFVARGRSQGSSKAFRVSSILTAVSETWRGYKSVSEFRDKAISERGTWKDEQS